MPEFSPNEGKVAIATLPVKPAGLACTAELWLASNMTKVATSGLIPFTSTGASQSINLPITMPGVEGTYPVYLDVFVAGQLIGAYRAVEDVVIAPVGVAEFVYVSSIRTGYASEYGIPRYWFTFAVDIKNIGTAPGRCTITAHYESGWPTTIYYDKRRATIQPGERVTFSGKLYNEPGDPDWWLRFNGISSEAGWKAS